VLCHVMMMINNDLIWAIFRIYSPSRLNPLFFIKWHVRRVIWKMKGQEFMPCNGTHDGTISKSATEPLSIDTSIIQHSWNLNGGSRTIPCG
jgi:hypothetical protein